MFNIAIIHQVTFDQIFVFGECED